MPTFTLRAASTQLSALIKRAEAGEEIIIMRGTKPVAKLVAIPAKPKRQFGLLKGLVKIGPEFFEPLPEEELKLWNGEE
ncbi:type II toxin-antitoxin system Phd/YefM family antitoxin [Reyranella sp.]|uniref:type II toxin-antitoxin system Phd/YefM family antitoxin n=1 Tax=Reyranella sp. TaxID=1929291 RepID=UPI003D0DDFC0